MESARSRLSGSQARFPPSSGHGLYLSRTPAPDTEGGGQSGHTGLGEKQRQFEISSHSCDARQPKNRAEAAESRVPGCSAGGGGCAGDDSKAPEQGAQEAAGPALVQAWPHQTHPDRSLNKWTWSVGRGGDENRPLFVMSQGESLHTWVFRGPQPQSWLLTLLASTRDP